MSGKKNRQDWVPTASDSLEKSEEEHQTTSQGKQNHLSGCNDTWKSSPKEGVPVCPTPAATLGGMTWWVIPKCPLPEQLGVLPLEFHQMDSASKSNHCPSSAFYQQQRPTSVCVLQSSFDSISFNSFKNHLQRYFYFIDKEI